ncbi:MAG: hypothetical protein LBC77_05060 [Spirochaetaceae bacterium]|jgi:hypothetical protein|nr:hypothetical protein [Spirochaetaceae bacterium]
MKLFFVNQLRLSGAFFLLFINLNPGAAAQEPPPPAPEIPVRGMPAIKPVVGVQRLAPPAVPEKLLPGLQKKLIEVKVEARVLSSDDEEVWKTESTKVTIQGRPVAIKLMGKNIAVIALFTPYIRRDGQWSLVAQGQIWLENEKKELRYETTIQTLRVKPGEVVYYYPIGSQRSGSGDYIEICLELLPWAESEPSSAEAPKPETPETGH